MESLSSVPRDVYRSPTEMRSSNPYDSPPLINVASEMRASPTWLFVLACVLTFFMVDLVFYMNDARWAYVIGHPFEYAATCGFAAGIAFFIGSIGVLVSLAPKQDNRRIAGRVIGGCCLGGAFMPSEPLARSIQRMFLNNPQHNVYVFILMLMICAALAIVVEQTFRRLASTMLPTTP